MVLDFASLLTGFYVFASHIIVGGVAIFLARRRGPAVNLTKRLLTVFAVTGFLGFQLYAMALPQAYGVLHEVFARPESGFQLFSREFVGELVREAASGFGAGRLLVALPFFVIAGAGVIGLFRRQWTLTLMLILPEILTAIALIAQAVPISPRFFLLALPLLILASVQGVFDLADLATRLRGKEARASSPTMAMALLALVTIVSVISLKGYYAFPKQAFRASIGYVETERRPGEIVIVLHLAEGGYRYYGDRLGLREGKDYFVVRSMADLNKVLAEHRGSPSLIVTTLPLFQRALLPEVMARVVKDWTRIRIFPGTVGDGNITIWRQRSP
jgi:hypothetical protein